MNLDKDSLYLYSVKVDKIIDGDTVDLVIDLGFKLHQLHRFRLHGINAPEKRGETHQAGIDATLFLSKIISPISMSGYLYAYTLKDSTDKYGRYLVQLWAQIAYTDPLNLRTAKWDCINGAWTNINELMIKAGYAVEYNK